MSSRKTTASARKDSPAHMLSYLEDLFEGGLLFGENAPMQAKLTRGAPESKVLLVTGSNASGKSFAVRVLATWLNNAKPNVEPLQISMKYRTMSGMHRAFMYGPFGDSEDSTGSVSLSALSGGFRTAKGRDAPCWLMLDEPDTGLSEDFGYALGTHIAQESNAGMGENCGGLVVVTHSRELVRGLKEHLALAPHFAHVGAPSLSLDEWLVGGQRRSVEELLALSTQALTTHRSIQKVLDGLKSP